MDLSNRNIDDIKHAKIDYIGMKLDYLYFNDFPLFSNVFINNHEFANYAN